MRNKANSILLGNITYSIFQFIILTVVVKFGTVTEVGNYTYALAIITPIFIFLSLQMRNVLATDVENTYSFLMIAKVRGVISILTIITGMILYIISEQNILKVIAILIIYKTIDSFFDLYFGEYLKEKNNKAMGLLLTNKSIVSGLAFVTTFLLTSNLVLSIFTQSLILLTTFIVTNNKQRKISLITFTKKHGQISDFLFAVIPLAFSGLIISIIPQIPKYYLGLYVGIKEVGYFSTISYIVVVGTLFVNTLNSAYYSTLTTYLSQNRINKFIKQNFKLSMLFIVIWLFIILGLCFWGEELLIFAFTKEYSNYTDEALIIAFSLIFLFLSTLFINITLYLKKYKTQLFIYIIVLLISTLTSSTLIPSKGLLGAVYSVLFVNLSQFIIALLVFLYILREKNNENKKYKA